MKFATIIVGDQSRVALIENDRPSRLLSAAFKDIGDLARHGLDETSWMTVSEVLSPTHNFIPCAPIPRPHRNIFCIGKNYREHAVEFAKSGFDSSASADAVPSNPILFSKVPESVIASGQSIVFNPCVSNMIDYEGELAVIIGRGGKHITRADAMRHVWGYTIARRTFTPGTLTTGVDRVTSGCVTQRGARRTQYIPCRKSIP